MRQMLHTNYTHNVLEYGKANEAYLLMFPPSLSLSPAAPVLETRSLPARSTKLNLLTFSPVLYSLNILILKRIQENKNKIIDTTLPKISI